MKAPEKTHLRIGEVPEALALADAVVAGMEPLCQSTRTHADLPRGSMLTYGPTRNVGQWLEDRRRIRATSPCRQATCGGDDNVPLSHDAKKPVEVVGEH